MSLLRPDRRQCMLLKYIYTIRKLYTSKDTPQMKTEEHDDKSAVEQYVVTTRDMERNLVWGSNIPPPDPELPVNASEVSALDPAHANQDMPSLATGEIRVVHIRQEQAKVAQSPLNIEQKWIISFQDEGETAQCWENPLMGWVSSADPLANNMRLQMNFNNASDAVYFAKKRGWNYVVEEPILRKVRDDGTLYHDNFLPQDIAAKLKRENHKCGHWHRDRAGTSHYFRPLNYHGNGTVRQHGPDGDQDIDPHVEGQYKIR